MARRADWADGSEGGGAVEGVSQHTSVSQTFVASALMPLNGITGTD